MSVEIDILATSELDVDEVTWYAFLYLRDEWRLHMFR